MNLIQNARNKWHNMEYMEFKILNGNIFDIVSYFVSYFFLHFTLKFFFLSRLCCNQANYTSSFVILENITVVSRIILHCRRRSTWIQWQWSMNHEWQYLTLCIFHQDTPVCYVHSQCWIRILSVNLIQRNLSIFIRL